MQSQSRREAPRKIRPVRAPRPEFTAAVRYLDGSRDIFRVRNADDMEDARDLVLSELGDVRSLVIALRR
jgi:hypothetical protein